MVIERGWFRLGWLAGLLCVAIGGMAEGDPPRLSEAVPNDVVAAYFGGQPLGPASGSDWSTLKLAAFLADRANQTGLLLKLDAKTRRWVDVVGAVSVALEYPHAVALLDVSARPREDGGHELAGLRAALIVRTGGDNDRLVERIQRLLSAYTNTEDADLVKQARLGVPSFTLRDRRLADWAVLSWGAYGDYYLITIGDGAFERVVSTIRHPKHSLAHEAWFTDAAPRAFASANAIDSSQLSHVEAQESSNRSSSTKGHVGVSSDARAFDGGVAWYVRFDLLRRGADPTFDAKVQWVQFSLGLASVERGLWMVVQSPATGSVEMVGIHRAKGQDTIHWLAGDVVRHSLSDGVIPKQASGYAVIDGSPPAIWRGIANAYFKSKSRRSQERVASTVDRIEAEAELSIERDIVALLGGPIVIHNYPQHALRLPLAWTVLIPILGEAKVLTDRVDRLLKAVREITEDGTCGDGIRLLNDPDGVWYIQYGLAGPALAVTDHWVVISFSPHAVRLNVAHISQQSTVP